MLRWRIEMNIAKIMIPKVSTILLREESTVRQGLEMMKHYGYTAIPVVDNSGMYVGSVSEGDFLRYILKIGSTDLKRYEQYCVSDILRRDFCPPLYIDSEEKSVISAVLNQNFVPIVDDRKFFCGIITRKSVIEYLSNVNNEKCK